MSQMERTFQRTPFSLSTPKAEAIVLEDMMQSQEILLSADEVEYWIWQERPPQLEALDIQFKDDKYHVRASWKNDDTRYTNITAIFTASWNPNVIEWRKPFKMNRVVLNKGYWTNIQFESLTLGEQDVLEWQEWLGFAGESSSEYDFFDTVMDGFVKRIRSGCIVQPSGRLPTSEQSTTIGYEHPTHRAINDAHKLRYLTPYHLSMKIQGSGTPLLLIMGVGGQLVQWPLIFERLWYVKDFS